MKKDKWIWMPHPAHLCVGNECQFHLSTYIGGYIVSTVGEWWPDSQVREIFASVRGKFGFKEIGFDRLYETAVFKAKKSKQKCCPWTVSNYSEFEMVGYNSAEDAYKGHMRMCEKYSK